MPISTTFATHYLETPRSHTPFHPACHTQGIGHMTTPSEFYANVNKTIYYLDTVLAPGSQVTFTGLIDGRIIWDTLADTIYPLGELNQVGWERKRGVCMCLWLVS